MNARVLLDAHGDLWIEDERYGMWLCLTDADGIAALRGNVHELTREQLEATFGPASEVAGR